MSARKAQAVLPLARGQDEEQWVARAQTETVRALEAAVRAAGPAETAKEEGWELICVPLSTEDRAKLDQAMALAGKVLGPGAPQWRRLEAICQEYLAAHPVEPSESEREQVLRWPASVAGWLESAMEALEEGTRRWAFLCPVEPVAASMPWPKTATPILTASLITSMTSCAASRRCAMGGTSSWANWGCSSACSGCGGP